MTTMNPYVKTGSVAHKTFEMAKAGTTRAALVAMFTKENVGPARLLRELKLQDFRNLTWEYTESEDGKVKITNVQEKGSKKAKSAAKAAPVAKKAASAKPAPKPVAKKAAAKVEAKPVAKKAAKAAAPVAAEPETK